MAESTLWRRAWRTILMHAITRPESAITIALAIITIGLFPRPFVFWRWWFWLILFLVAELLIVYTSIRDERTAEQVVGEMLRERYNPVTITRPTLRAQVERALQYRQSIQHQVDSTRRGVLRDHLAQTADSVDEWLGQVYALAQRLDRLSADPIIQKDLQAAPGEIARYRTRLEQADDDGVKQQLQQAITSKETQLSNLEQLARTMERGQLQLENTVSALGTIYSQFLLLEAQDVESGRMSRLNQDIAEQVKSLNDVVSTLDELYHRSAEG